MKKLFCFILMFFVISCSQTNEDKIRSAFKRYAEANFDDPSQLMEIVSIDSIDTISTLFFKSMVKQRYDIHLKTCSLCDSTDSVIFRYLRDERFYSSLRRIPQLKEAWGEKIKIQGIIVDHANKYVLNELVEEELKDINAMKDTVFLEQRLSYRLNDNNGKRLEHCYVYSDTLFNNIQFKKERMKPDEGDVGKLLIKISAFNEKYYPFYDTYHLKAQNNIYIVDMLRKEIGNY